MIWTLSMKTRLGKQMKEGGVEMCLFDFITHRALYSEYSGRKHNLHFLYLYYLYCTRKQLFKVSDLVYFQIFPLMNDLPLPSFKYLVVLLAFITVVHCVLKGKLFKRNYFRVTCFCYTTMAHLKTIQVHWERYPTYY